MITIVDYGLGNIQAFANIFQRLKVPFNAGKTPEALQAADKLILPGVGAFDWAMQRLEASGLRPCLDEQVLSRRKPVLGVCVGMQMMGQSSEEGVLPGLGWIDAVVKRFDEQAFDQPTHLPHMGWNDVRPVRDDGLFRELEAPRFYFLHSYYVLPNHPKDILATTEYNGPFASAVRVGNVLGTQFHPEKSHQWGIQLLKNFAES